MFPYTAKLTGVFPQSWEVLSASSIRPIPWIRSQSRGKSLPTPPPSPSPSSDRFLRSVLFFRVPTGDQTQTGRVGETTGLGYKVVPRFGEFCSCCCISLLPELGCSILATLGPPFSRALYWSGLLARPCSIPFFPSLFLSLLLWPTFLSFRCPNKSKSEEEELEQSAPSERALSRKQAECKSQS